MLFEIFFFVLVWLKSILFFAKIDTKDKYYFVSNLSEIEIGLLAKLDLKNDTKKIDNSDYRRSILSKIKSDN